MHKSEDFLPRSNWHVPDWLKAARSHGLLSRLPESLVETVVRGASRVEYPAGAVALRWDESPKTAFVLRGTFRGFIASVDGGQVTTRYLKAGDIAGVFAPRLPRLARGIQTLEPGELLLVDSERVKELALSYPAFAWEMIQELTTVLNSNQKALYVRAFGSVRQRVVSAIVERAAVAGKLEAGGSVAGTQHELAIAIGSVREVVASELQQLKREGVLDIHRGEVAELRVVGTAGSVKEAIEAAQTLRPQVVLMDFRLSDGDGPEATERIRHDHPEVAVLFLSADVSDDAMMRAIDAGACGYISKAASAEELTNAIRRAGEGEVLLPAATMSRLLARQREARKTEAAKERLSEDLTAREREVLNMM